MTPVPFKIVDVFTEAPFRGNPVAVVLEGSCFDSEQMQRIAQWMNLSETTFVLKPTTPGADYRVRIFTPASELPFAGHPTIGTAHALLEAGRVFAHDGRLMQECGVGLVRLTVADGPGVGRTIAFELPEPVVTELTDLEVDELQAILGMPLHHFPLPRLVDVGARWIVAQLPDASAVLAVRPDEERMRIHDIRARATGVVIFGVHETGAVAQVEVRAFAPSCGVSEDPVCGSGNGCMAVFMRDTGQMARFGGDFVAAQGQVVGRAGLLKIRLEKEYIRVGGSSVTCVDGSLIS